MPEIEIRRHSCTKKGPGRGHGSHLSADGVLLAREVGRVIGPFDLVLASEVPRTVETAVAMGFAVDHQVSVPDDTGYEALTRIGHHERWSWSEPWVRFAELVRAGGPVAVFGCWLRQTWAEALESVVEGGRVLVISHGRDIESGVVACLDDFQPEEFKTWGEPLHQCEGVRLSYADGRFHEPRVIRERRCAGMETPGASAEQDGAWRND
jgi:broad specificity phosphatase PhoE